MYPYYCQQTGTCPFFPMGYPPQYPMPYMMNYGYPFAPGVEELEEEEHEHKHHRNEEDGEERLEEETIEDADDYRMAGPAVPPFAPGHPGPAVPPHVPVHPGPGQFTTPEGILRYVELYQPDIIRTMVSRGIPIAEARRIVRRIIAITLRFCREARY